jgi:hypothetical protein
MKFGLREQFSRKPQEHPNETPAVLPHASGNARFAQMLHRRALHFDEGRIASRAHHFQDVFRVSLEMKIVVKLAVKTRCDGIDSVEFLGDSGSIDLHADVSL